MVDEIVRHQDGVITLPQARRAGLSQDAIDRLVRSRHWRRLARGVYFVDDRPFTDAARIRGMVWSYGNAAAASGLAAAWWHGLSLDAPDVVEVTVPRKRQPTPLPGSRLRRRDLVGADIVERQRLRLTSLPLTIVEASVRPGGGSRVMDSALQRRANLRELQLAHLRNKGRHGAPAARRLLEVASAGARSHAERLLIQLLKDDGITGWIANYPVGGYLVDIAFPGLRIAIEVDGWAFHSDRQVFQSDRVRQNQIALLGWQVLRFTWFDLTERPQRVLAQIRRAICAA